MFLIVIMHPLSNLIIRHGVNELVSLRPRARASRRHGGSFEGNGRTGAGELRKPTTADGLTRGILPWWDYRIA